MIVEGIEGMFLGRGGERSGGCILRGTHDPLRISILLDLEDRPAYLQGFALSDFPGTLVLF